MIILVCGIYAAEAHAMPTYLMTGELAQPGYVNMEQGPAYAQSRRAASR